MGVSRNIQEKSALADTRLNESLEVVEGHTKQLEKLQGLSEETKKRLENNETELAKNTKKCETAEAELSKVEFKVNSCVEELAKMDQFAKVAEVRKLEKTLAEKSGSSEAKEVQEKLRKVSEDTKDSLRVMNEKQTSLGVALSGVQAEVKKLADMGGVTEDISVISSKVNQLKAKLIDLEANVTLQERSNGKLSEDLKKMSETLTESKANLPEAGEAGGDKEGVGVDGVRHGEGQHHPRTGAGLPHWTEDQGTCMGQESRNDRGRPTEHLADGGGEQDPKGDEGAEEESRGNSDGSSLKEDRANRARSWSSPAEGTRLELLPTVRHRGEPAGPADQPTGELSAGA